MTAKPATPDAMPGGKRAGFFAPRPDLYIALVLCAVLGAYGYKLRTEGIFACQAAGYAPGWYLSYCHAPAYGDYEHGAFWFSLEPGAGESASKANALFLGNSRMQIALSTAATSNWFSAAAATYYLMGFGYSENVTFAREILRRIEAKTGAYIINIDGFFVQTETVPAKTVMRDSTARLRSEAKRMWQFFHALICRKLATFCGNEYVIFRSTETGAYRVWGLDRFRSRGVSYDRSVDHAAADREIATAKEFLRTLRVAQDCIILTIVPNVDTKIATARAIAAALGMDLVAPEPDGLQTFDGSHLDSQSAERWSQAFLQEAAPRLRQCTRSPG